MVYDIVNCTNKEVYKVEQLRERKNRVKCLREQSNRIVDSNDNYKTTGKSQNTTG